jgi:hypothetical protein
MTRWNDLDTALGPWLEENADARMPDYVDDMLARTRLATQRPAWRSVEHWMPPPVHRRWPLVRPVWLLLVLALLVSALISTVVGSGWFDAPIRPWSLSVTDMRVSSSEIGFSGQLVVQVTVANAGTAPNPRTHVHFQNVLENFGLKGCIPDTCQVAHPSDLDITFRPVPAGEASTFRWVFRPRSPLETSPETPLARAVEWGFCVYAEPVFRDPVWCENTTTLVRPD